MGVTVALAFLSEEGAKESMFPESRALSSEGPETLVARQGGRPVPYTLPCRMNHGFQQTEVQDCWSQGLRWSWSTRNPTQYVFSMSQT